MVLLHGQHTESDVFQFLKDLEKKLTFLDDFDSHVGKFAKTLRKLALAGAPVQALAAYNHLKLSLSSFPAFDKHVDDHVTATPVLARRAHNGLAALVRLHLASVKAKSGRNPFAGSASLVKQIAKLERQVAVLNARSPPTPNPHPQGHSQRTLRSRPHWKRSCPVGHCPVLPRDFSTATNTATTVRTAGLVGHAPATHAGTWQHSNTPPDLRPQCEPPKRPPKHGSWRQQELTEGHLYSFIFTATTTRTCPPLLPLPLVGNLSTPTRTHSYRGLP
jgi:hypothetical protein